MNKNLTGTQIETALELLSEFDSNGRLGYGENDFMVYDIGDNVHFPIFKNLCRELSDIGIEYEYSGWNVDFENILTISWPNVGMLPTEFKSYTNEIDEIPANLYSISICIDDDDIEIEINIDDRYMIWGCGRKMSTSQNKIVYTYLRETFPQLCEFSDPYLL